MRGFLSRRLPAVGLLVCLGVAAVIPETQAGDIFVFGDSLSDTGNLFLLTGGANGSIFSTDPAKNPRLPSPPYYEGRASNGPVWIEPFAAHLGLAVPQPAFAGGTNYAFIGAVTGPGSSSPYPIPTITTQVGLYVGGAGMATPEDLFVVWGGANDFLYGQTDWTIPVTNIVNAIETLHKDVQATRFLVPNLPPLGRTPTGAALDPVEFDFLTDQFNTLLNTELDALRDALGVTLYEFDIHAQFENLLADPTAYALANVTDTALVVDENPSSPLFGYPTYPYTLQFDPAESLFFDGVHPTAFGHALIAEAAAASVPEPSALVLCLVGLVLLALRRRLGA